MQPFYFGDSDKPLFGFYHAPVSQIVRDTGVVLCYPGPQEYMRVHWAFRKLAADLSKSGFHVLRFDYFGTGDSGGETAEGSTLQWKEDIGTATRELVEISGVRQISIVGVRLGAALAAQASTDGIRVRDLVLWDPVIVGLRYLDELRALHQTLFSGTHVSGERMGWTELIGYWFSDEMMTQIERVNLLDQQACVAEKTFIVVSEERGEYLELAAKYKRSGVDFEYRFVPDSTEWGKAEDFDQALLVNDMIHDLVALLKR